MTTDRQPDARVSRRGTAAAARIYAASMYWVTAVIVLAELGLFGDPLERRLLFAGVILFLASSLVRKPDPLFWLAIAGLAIGQLLVIVYRLSPDLWAESLTANAGILVLFVAIPFLSLPMSDSRYLDAVRQFIGRETRPGRTKFVLLVFVHLCMTIVMNIASIPALQKMLRRMDLSPRYLVRLYTAGYASYMVFSPFDGVVNMVLLMASVSYDAYLPVALPMVLSITAVSAFLLPRRPGAAAQPNEDAAPAPRGYRRIVELVAHIVAMIALVAAGNFLFHFRTPILMTAILITLYALFWSATLGKSRLWFSEVARHATQIIEYRRFLAFLLAMNFFGAVLAHTPLKGEIGGWVHYLSGLPQYFMLLAIVAATLLLSLAGIHMMIVVTALGFAVAPAALGLTAPAYALLLLTCWYVAMSISPFVPFTAVVSEAVGGRPLSVSARYNPLFTAAMLLIGPAVVLLANML